MAIPKATPKARLFQIYPFGKGLNFSTESVPTLPSEGTVPGSTSFFTPNHAVMFRCTLSLPDGSQVISDLFQRKKEAEHDASQRALDQMRITAVPSLDGLSHEERWENLRRRIVDTFSDKNVGSYYPLREHFKMAFRREGAGYGQVPIAAIAALDAKVNTLCKSIDRKSETDPVYAAALICEAASKCPSLELDRASLRIRRKDKFKPEVELDVSVRKQLSTDDPEPIGQQCQQGCESDLRFSAVYIPFSAGMAVHSSPIHVHKGQYYLDVLAEKIGLEDGFKLVVSRPIGKVYPALRMFWAFPKLLPKVEGPDSDLINLSGEDMRRYSTKEETLEGDRKKNVRATLLMGYPIYGDVLLASVGCDWKNPNLYSSDYSLNSYNRLLLTKFPQGNYKVSRLSVLAADLPTTYSSRLQWRGTSPRGLLIEFCQQHRLPEPVFVVSHEGKEESQVANDPEGHIPGSAEGIDLDETRGSKFEEVEGKVMPENGCTKDDDDNHAPALHGGLFAASVTLEVKKGSVTEFESGSLYKNRHDAIQSCALKALHRFRPWFEQCLTGSYEPLMPSDVTPGGAVQCGAGFSWEENPTAEEFFSSGTALDTSQIGKVAAQGAMVTVRYNVRWLRGTTEMNQSSEDVLESSKDFVFELGSGAVIAELDALVGEMPVGRIASFCTSLPPPMMLLAAYGDLACKDDLLGSGKLKYTVQLLKYAEPPEDRMEAAHFKPSLSKQRLQCALSTIQNLKAKTLIDLGCGSGSLMENLLEERTGLVELTGVDISPKSLVRAAKVLSGKLLEDLPGKEELATIKLYEGSIVDFHPHMRGIDVAVCIEVVEHMDPEPLSKFGRVVLGELQPRVLIVSTPNFEYNPILQQLDWDPLTNSLSTGTEDAVKNGGDLGSVENNSDLFNGGFIEKRENRVNSESALGASMEKRIRLSDGKDVVVKGSSQGRNPQPMVKFRNDDHRFEWTRAEFRKWATDLASAHDYDVKFDGVGHRGDFGADTGPGFASQIAVFTIRSPTPMQVEVPDKQGYCLNSESEHKIVWQWIPVKVGDTP